MADEITLSDTKASKKLIILATSAILIKMKVD